MPAVLAAPACHSTGQLLVCAFVMDQTVETNKKLSVCAQGEAMCCVTSAAFEHMLQLRNQPLLEIVMGHAVIFSRMKSHQKGQVMDLLGSKGLHLMHNGQQQHIPVSFCPLNPVLAHVLKPVLNPVLKPVLNSLLTPSLDSCPCPVLNEVVSLFTVTELSLWSSGLQSQQQLELQITWLTGRMQVGMCTSLSVSAEVTWWSEGMPGYSYVCLCRHSYCVRGMPTCLVRHNSWLVVWNGCSRARWLSSLRSSTS